MYRAIKSFVFATVLCGCRVILGIDDHELGPDSASSGGARSSSVGSGGAPDWSGGAAPVGGGGAPNWSGGAPAGIDDGGAVASFGGARAAGGATAAAFGGAKGESGASSGGAPALLSCAPGELSVCDAPEKLRDGLRVLASGLQRPTSVRIDERFVYWINQATEATRGSIMRAELATGEVQVVHDSLARPVALRASQFFSQNDWLYFTDDDAEDRVRSGLFRVENRADGKIEPVDVDGFVASRLVLRRGTFYSGRWSAERGAQVRAFGDGSSCVLVVRSDARAPFAAFDVDNTQLYFADGGAIFVASRECNSSSAPVALLSGVEVRAMVASQTQSRDFLKWLTPNALVTVKKSDPLSAPPSCSPASDPLDLAVADEAAVYTNAGDGSVRIAMHRNGRAEVHAVACHQGQPSSLVVREEDETVAWTNQASGEVMVLAGELEWWAP